MTAKTTKTADRVQVITNTDSINKLQAQLDRFEETFTLSSQQLKTLAAERDDHSDYRRAFIAGGAYELAEKDHERFEHHMRRQSDRLAMLQGLNTLHAEKLARALADLVEPEVAVTATTAENVASVKLTPPSLAVVSTPNNSGNAEFGRFLQVVYRVPRMWRGLDSNIIGKALTAAKLREMDMRIDGSISYSESADSEGATFVYRIGAVGDIVARRAAQ